MTPADFAASCTPLKALHQQVRGFVLKGMRVESTFKTALKHASAIPFFDPYDPKRPAERRIENIIDKLDPEGIRLLICMMAGIGHISLLERLLSEHPDQKENKMMLRCLAGWLNETRICEKGRNKAFDFLDNNDLNFVFWNTIKHQDLRKFPWRHFVFMAKIIKKTPVSGFGLHGPAHSKFSLYALPNGDSHHKIGDSKSWSDEDMIEIGNALDTICQQACLLDLEGTPNILNVFVNEWHLMLGLLTHMNHSQIKTVFERTSTQHGFLKKVSTSHGQISVLKRRQELDDKTRLHLIGFVKKHSGVGPLNDGRLAKLCTNSVFCKVFNIKPEPV